MTDKKLTDEDVVEGLERCISTTTAGACVGCPFNKQKLCDAVILVFIGAAVLSVYLISKVFLILLVFICWAVILV